MKLKNMLAFDDGYSFGSARGQSAGELSGKYLLRDPFKKQLEYEAAIYAKSSGGKELHLFKSYKDVPTATSKFGRETLITRPTIAEAKAGKRGERPTVAEYEGMIKAASGPVGIETEALIIPEEPVFSTAGQQIGTKQTKMIKLFKQSVKRGSAGVTEFEMGTQTARVSGLEEGSVFFNLGRLLKRQPGSLTEALNKQKPGIFEGLDISNIREFE